MMQHWLCFPSSVMLEIHLGLSMSLDDRGTMFLLEIKFETLFCLPFSLYL